MKTKLKTKANKVSKEILVASLVNLLVDEKWTLSIDENVILTNIDNKLNHILRYDAYSPLFPIHSIDFINSKLEEHNWHTHKVYVDKPAEKIFLTSLEIVEDYIQHLMIKDFNENN